MQRFKVGLCSACRYIIVSSTWCCCHFSNEKLAFNDWEIWPSCACISTHPQWANPRQWLAPSDQPTPSSVSLLTEAQGHLSSTQCLCYCFSQERKIFLCIYVFVIGKKERSIGLNPTLFIYFLSFLDPQAAEFHFHWHWKGSGLLSELEERVHAHLCMECVLFICLFNPLLGNIYLFKSKYSWRAWGRDTQGTGRKRCDPHLPNTPDSF